MQIKFKNGQSELFNQKKKFIINKGLTELQDVEWESQNCVYGYNV